MRLDVNFPAFHGRICAAEAKKRLLSEISYLSVGKYLVRLCGRLGDYVISYLTKELTVKHLIIPKQKHGKLFRFNPQLKTLQDKVNFLTKQIRFITFSYGVSYLDFNNQDVFGAGNDREDLDFCTICDQGISDQKQKSHRQQHTVEFCPNCGYIIPHNSNQSHKEKCSDVKVKCEVCAFETRHRESLKKHMKVLHSENSGREKCQKCGKTFTCLDKLESHMQIKHYFSFPCKTCGKSYVTRQGRNTHIRNKHMTYVVPAGDKSKELDYKSLEANVKFLPQKQESPLKDSFSNTELETRTKCYGKKIIAESERLERNEKMNIRRREKRKRTKDKTEEEILFVAFK